MLLILARHGNTFNKGDKPYRVGGRNDLPLVQKGLEQAQAFANALLEKKIKPAAVYCGTLCRTSKFAQIITQTLKLELAAGPIIDQRLNELDLGGWAGLTDDQVKEKFGDELENWKKFGKWPEMSGWPETEAQVIDQIRSFINDLTQKYKPTDTVVAVSSNGRIRYFLKLIDTEFENRLKNGTVKVGTGQACVISYKNNKLELMAWNINPEILNQVQDDK